MFKAVHPFYAPNSKAVACLFLEYMLVSAIKCLLRQIVWGKYKKTFALNICELYNYICQYLGK